MDTSVLKLTVDDQKRDNYTDKPLYGKPLRSHFVLETIEEDQEDEIYSSGSSIIDDDQQPDIDNALQNTDSEKVKSILNTMLYSRYQHDDDSGTLETLSHYYYEDYLNILEIVWKLYNLPEHLNLALEKYISDFQNSINACLENMGKSLFNVGDAVIWENYLFACLPNNSNCHINRNLSHKLSQLELALHHLTEAKILYTFDRLLEFATNDWGSQENTDKEPLMLAVFSQFFDRIDTWSGFFEQVYALYPKEDETAERRYQYLLKWYIDTQSECCKGIIEMTQKWVSGVKNQCKSLQAGENTLFQLEKNLECYNKASQAVRCLSLLERALSNVSLLAECLRLSIDFNDCQKFYLAFFPKKTEELFIQFEEHYDEMIRQKDLIFNQGFQLVKEYRMLKNTILCWRDFINLYSATCTHLDKNVYLACESWQDKFAKSKIGSEDFLKMLILLAKAIFEDRNLYFLSYKTAYQKTTLLKSIRQLIKAGLLALEDAGLNDSSRYNDYQTTCEQLEAAMKEEYLQFHQCIKTTICLLDKQYVSSSLRVMLGIGKYKQAVYQFQKAIKIYQNYFEAFDLFDKPSDATNASLEKNSTQLNKL